MVICITGKGKENEKMKYALILFFVPFLAFATCEDCQNLIDNLSSQVSVLRRSNDEIISANNLISSKQQLLLGQIRSGRTEQIQSTNAVSSVWDEMESTAEQMGLSIGIISADTSAVSQQLTIFSNTLSNWSCSCDESSGGCSCDFTGVISAINDCHSRLEDIYGYVRDTQSSVALIETCISGIYETQLPDMIGSLHSISNSVINILSSMDSVLTNKYQFAVNSNYGYQPSSFNYITRFGVVTSRNTGYLKTGSYSAFDALRVLAYTVPHDLSDFQNTFYDFGYRQFPILTNTVGTLTKSSTNFFSFFRAEIGVHGVLEDWTAQDGSYYDFLTNHYIQVVTGGTLSGNQSSKTNWFSRIETLLAALVFGDEGTSTNTVDSSAGSEFKAQISSSFNQLIDGPQNEMVHDLEEITPNVIEQVRRFSGVFTSASMPSNITLFSQDGEDGFKIAFEISNDSVYYDIFRNITTLCWSLVGLFFVYRFLVWSITKIVVLVQFCFNVFTDIFKAR